MIQHSKLQLTGVFQERLQERLEMVESQIVRRGISDSRVLEAMRAVPRHLFVPEDLQELAYDDGPLPIGQHQTISQPYIVALMSEVAQIKPTDRVLEIGTGSGYQTAILAELAREVYTIEIIAKLGALAQSKLEPLYNNVHSRIGNGYLGWPEAAPFNIILAAAAPEQIPQALLEQLSMNGRFVLPVGAERQELLRLTKTSQGIKQEKLIPVTFVPMTGQVF